MSMKVQNHPFIPRGMPIVTQAGLFAPRSILGNINGFLSQYGEVHGLVNPNILRGRSMRDAIEWFQRRIDDIRIGQTKDNLKKFWQELKCIKQVLGKEHWIQQQFNLGRGSVLADFSDFVIEQVFDLIGDKKSRFFKQLMALKPRDSTLKMTPKDENSELSSVLSDYQHFVKDEFKNSGLAKDPTHEIKIANSIFDLISPRVLVLAGHSMGGLTALQAMQEDNNDIAMAFAWGSPVNGANPIALPKAFPYDWLSRKVCPIVNDLDRESAILRKTREANIPADTSAFSIEHKDRKDFVILDSTLNPTFLGMHSIKVEPRESTLFNLLPTSLYPIGLACTYPPPFLKARANRFKYHAAYLDKEHVPFYFSDEPGSVLYEFTSGEAGAQNIRRLLNRTNYGGLQASYLTWLKEKLERKEVDLDTSLLRGKLEELTEYPLPSEGSEYFRAQELLNTL